MIKLGVLNAVTPSEEEEFGVKENQAFVDFLGMAPNDFKLVEYRITEDHFPQTVDECDAYLITGSPKGAYDSDPWIAKLQAFIREVYSAKVKMVGICFGHQVLAHALGGKAEKSPKGWGLGMNTFDLVEKRPFMTPMINSGNFYFCHQDQVTQLPPDAQLLAGNEFCPNGMFVIDDQILGLQAHPEFTPETNEKALNWVQTDHPELEERVESARRVQDENHNHIVSHWIVNFIRA